MGREGDVELGPAVVLNERDYGAAIDEASGPYGLCPGGKVGGKKRKRAIYGRKLVMLHTTHVKKAPLRPRTAARLTSISLIFNSLI